MPKKDQHKDKAAAEGKKLPEEPGEEEKDDASSEDSTSKKIASLGKKDFSAAAVYARTSAESKEPSKRMLHSSPNPEPLVQIDVEAKGRGALKTKQQSKAK
jgi:hypothetical protein